MTNPPSKTLGLHIGSHKTGTSSIQAWSRWLMDHQLSPYHYATTGRHSDAHFKACNEFVYYANTHLLRLLTKEIEQSDEHFFLFSSERLSLFNSREISDFLSTLSSPVYTISTYATLRRVDLNFESSINQTIKNGCSYKALSMQSALKRRSSLVTSLLRWMAAVGENNFHLMIFDPALWPNGSLWSAWWNLLGIEEPLNEKNLPADLIVKNKSFSALTLSVVNAIHSRLAERKHNLPRHLFANHITQPVEDRLRQLTGDRYTSKLRVFSTHERKNLITAAAEIERPLFDRLGMTSPFIDLSNEPDLEENSSILLNPHAPHHSQEQRDLFDHLLEYADALGAETLEMLNIAP